MSFFKNTFIINDGIYKKKITDSFALNVSKFYQKDPYPNYNSFREVTLKYLF